VDAVPVDRGQGIQPRDAGLWVVMHRVSEVTLRSPRPRAAVGSLLVTASNRQAAPRGCE
jgi:hypothetical protein